MMNDIKKQVALNLEEIKRKKAIRNKYSNIFNYITSIILPSLVIIIFFNIFAGIAKVKGNSMINTLTDGDFVIYNRFNNTYERNDIIVALKKNENKLIIKRIIGLPNDTIDIIDGYVYVNREKLDESDYIIEGSTVIHDVAFPITLKENEYFLLGDNRETSLDSRSLATGNILKKQILGKVIFIARIFK